MFRNRPCNSRTRTANRWTRKELVDVATQNGVPFRKRTMSQICTNLNNISQPPGRHFTPSGSLPEMPYRDLQTLCMSYKRQGINIKCVGRVHMLEELSQLSRKEKPTGRGKSKTSSQTPIPKPLKKKPRCAIHKNPADSIFAPGWLDTSDQSYCDAITDFIPAKCMPPGYRVTSVLGSGFSGVVLAICSNRKNCKAIKIVRRVRSTFFYGKTDEEWEDLRHHEFTMQQELHKIGLAPAIYNYCEREEEHVDEGTTYTVIFYVMEKVAGNLESWLKHRRNSPKLKDVLKQLCALIAKLRTAGYIHGDFHAANIGFYKDKRRPSGIRLIPIDFERTEKYEGKYPVDAIRFRHVLLGTKKAINVHNYNYISNHFINACKLPTKYKKFGDQTLPWQILEYESEQSRKSRFKVR